MHVLLRVCLVAVTLFLAPAGLLAENPLPEAALIKADTDFCQLCVAKGMQEAFSTYAAEDATVLAPGMDPVKGKAAIRKLYEGTESLKLVWRPLKADVAKSGDLGYTYGTYELHTTGQDGNPVTRTGKYTTIWKKQADGAWRFVLDVGNQNPLAPAS